MILVAPMTKRRRPSRRARRPARSRSRAPRRGWPVPAGSSSRAGTTPSWSRRSGATTCGSRAWWWSTSTASTTSPSSSATSGPAPERKVGVLVDHLVPGSKESRIAQAVAKSPIGEHVLIVGHPYVDVWQAVKPERLGIERWPTIPRIDRVEEGRLPVVRLAAPRPGRHRPRLEAHPRPRLVVHRPGAGVPRPGRGADRLRDRIVPIARAPGAPTTGCRTIGTIRRGQGNRSRTTPSASRRPRAREHQPVTDHLGQPGRHRCVHPGRVVEHVQRQSLGQPDLEQHPLDPAGLVVEHLAGVRRGRSGGDARGVRGRVLDVPPAHAADVRVGARPDAPPVGTGPVEPVVLAPGVRPARPVGHLVPAEPGRRERLVGERGTCRRGRPRPASAAPRSAPAAPARCRPRRSGSTPRRGPAGTPAPRGPTYASPRATPPGCRRSGRG